MASQAIDAGERIALVIKKTIHRYGIEGMLRSTVRTASVRHLGFGGESIRGSDGERLDILLAAAADLETEHTRDAVRGLCEAGPGLLLLVDGPDALDVPWMATCGAQGFLDWSELEPRILADAVCDVMAGKFYVSASLAQRLVMRAGRVPQDGPPQRIPAGAALTPRELQVLRLVADGLSNKQVSRRLLISEHGVKRLVGNILAKLNCPNRTLAAVRARDVGLLPV
ncbi:response regulator transcription factor [Kitasatospora sp. NPDC008050]|uniref:response regulator transcription factor n=1 Tax=Kitasatospora sp. NPDC008050 TaxID=3364021 RepID=UPI0036EE09CB